MLEKIKGLVAKYREQLLYLIFGGLTTAVDWGVSFVLYYVWGAAIEETVFLIHAANLIAWAAAVLFAYVTNRIWVFGSPRRGFVPIVCEFLAFAGGRVSTLLLQEAMFWIFFDMLGINEYAVKLVAAVLVVIANYFISKLFVFRNRSE
ncbi:MAG: GtrA family protein [Clostridia bacterium]|nr:GtrA family protein [Clostridia bacterium]